VANTPTSPLDATGRAAEQAAKKNAKALQDRKDEISIAAQVEAETLETTYSIQRMQQHLLFLTRLKTSE